MLVTGPKDFLQARQRRFEFDFESEEEFTFCAYPPFNTLSTKKFKEIVLKAKTTFKYIRRKRDIFAEKTPSMIGCLQGLWH